MAEGAATNQGQSNGMAAVAYILTWITGLIVYFTAKKDDKFTRFHALQAIGLGVVITVFYIIWYVVLGLLLSSGSWGAAGAMGVLSLLLWLAFLAVIIICAVKAYQGSRFQLPLVGPIAQKNA